MDASLAITYTLIHSFLKKHSHTKAALAVKKAAKDIVILKDDIETEGPYLDTIIIEWKAAKTAAAKSASSSNSDSEDSSDSSDSDSSDSDSTNSDTSDPSDSSDTSSTSKKSTPKLNLTKGKDSKLAKVNEQVKTKVVLKAASSSDDSSSDSDSSSSSSSDSDSDSSDSDTGTTNSKSTQKLNKTKAGRKAKAELQSSQTLTSGSSSGSSASEAASGRKPLKGDKSAGNDDNSDSESPSSDSENDGSVKSKCARKMTTTPIKELKPKVTKLKQRKSSSSGSSSSGSDSSTDEAEPEIMKPNKKHITTSGGNETPVQATKKRRTTEDGAAVVTATTETPSLPQSGPHIKANGKPARKTNTPFQRVNPEKVDQQVLLQNNGYIAKAAPANDYGARAHQDLIVTRGAGFRKEKNKKKRGSYKGGTITLESHSFKFT